VFLSPMTTVGPGQASLCPLVPLPAAVEITAAPPQPKRESIASAAADVVGETMAPKA
jgi:hypothetical protein